MEDLKGETDKSFSMLIIEEEVKVDKKVVEKGKVKIHKTVKEETESLNLPVMTGMIIVSPLYRTASQVLFPQFY